MRTLRDIGELDAVLAACDAAATDDDLRAIFATVRMEPPTDLSPDPFSTLYRDQQMSLYRGISGRDYALANEATPFDVAQAARTPFPYSTGSCQTTGDHLVVIGEFLRHLRLAPNSRVLEFGPGWGNLTLTLAALGHRVTAVDVEPRFCDLVARRAEQLGLSLDVVNADFGWAASVTEPFDAVIFFECFHHAADHLGVLRSLHGAIKPGGRVYLGAEPILADFPIPWGLRMDGQSLWSIRKFGWMELGFRDDYFRAALDATEWSGIRHPVQSPAIWELSSRMFPLRFGVADPGMATITGRLAGTELVLEDAPPGPALFGPYAHLPAGRFLARIEFRRDRPLLGKAEMQVCVRGANEVLASRPIDAAAVPPERAFVEVGFSLSEACDDLEVRLLNEQGFSAHLTAVEIIRT